MRKIVVVLALAFAALPVPAFASPGRPEVVGGVRVPAPDYPWVVHLSTGCAGALIAPAYVLTAAHCTGPTGVNRRIRVKAGSHDLSDPLATVVVSQYVWRAAGFQTITQGRDWAVI